jgi:hypothetical protein
MTPLPYRHRLAALTIAVLTGSLPLATQADDRDLRATTVPASSCAVHTPTPDWDPHPVREGGLVGVRGGTMVLIDCPLPLNNVDLGGTTNDNDMSSSTFRARSGDDAQDALALEIGHALSGGAWLP